jgi:Fe-S-cluster containining protein
MNSKKFNCEQCGYCCKSFGKDKGIALWPFERDKLIEIANKREIKLDIRPLELYEEEISGLVFCFQFALFSQPCPFLSDMNTCSIYKDRPLVCRRYPLGGSVAGSKSVFDLFGHCEFFDHSDYLKKYFGYEEEINEHIKEYLEKTYGSCYITNLENDKINKEVSDKFNKLEEQGKIKLTRINKTDKKVLSYEEFLNQSGLN